MLVRVDQIHEMQSRAKSLLDAGLSEGDRHTSEMGKLHIDLALQHFEGGRHAEADLEWRVAECYLAFVENGQKVLANMVSVPIV